MFQQIPEIDRSSLCTKRPGFEILKGCIVATLCVLACGCHDGPLYALKKVNPYFALREWKRDRKLGVTDHQRRLELESLADQIADMSAKDQAFWANHLGRIMANDPSPEMRRLTVLAASRMKDPAAMGLIEQGLDDENLKVQMEACRSLGKRPEPEAAQMLASTLGTTTEVDVKNSAIRALGNHKGDIPTDSLRVVLEGQDPATIDLAMTSLRGVMGKDLGNDPKQWIAVIDQQQMPEGTDQSGGGSGEVRVAEGEGSIQR